MKKLTLHCENIQTIAELHTQMRELMSFPDYYGENFDAMYDCLTEIGEPTRLEIRNLKKSGLGAAANVFRQVLLDADQSNPNFGVYFTRTVG